MTQILFVLLSVSTAFAGKPKFHCYTLAGQHVSAYQTAVKCQGSDKMEIVCTYQAGCMPAAKPGEPPEKSDDELNTMIVSNELKQSMLICKSKGEIKNGQITQIDCPSPTQCVTDGLFNGVSAGINGWQDKVSAPQQGGPRVTR